MLVCNRVREESFELIKVSDLVFSIFFGLKKVKLLQVVFKFCQMRFFVDCLVVHELRYVLNLFYFYTGQPTRA